MSFWKPKKPPLEVSDKPQPKPKPPKKTTRRSGKPVPFEIKALALEAVLSGADRREIAQIAGVQPCTVDSWLNIYKRDGMGGLCRKPSTLSASKICSALEERIIQHRKDHPEHGVRRIHDELRNNEALEISPEKIRQVVNTAGLGNSHPKSKRRPPQVRRFERKTPNAMWQIDIFTFDLKRMYKAYLVGIIDDHSRYMVGWGLFRQQTADSVLEVVKGAIGEWGAPRELLSDNGRQFVAWRGETKFQKVLKKHGIQHVRSAPRHPMTLGKIERFWQTIWKEFLFEATFASFADACLRLDAWMAFYNHQRPHQGIGGACPADRFYGMAQDVEQARQQGCRENSERVALGQEPKPPLYLLGRLGGTDVRVVRKGDDIELKVGDAIHEVAHLQADLEGGDERAEASEVEGSGQRPEVCGGGVCAQEGSLRIGAMPPVRGNAADPVPSNGCGAKRRSPGSDREAPWPSRDTRSPDRAGEAPGADEGAGSGAEAGAPEEPSGAGTPGDPGEDGTSASDGGGEKNQARARPKAPEWY